MAYWLMKSEPDVYSLSDLQRDQRTTWEGVRNYQARNFLRDAIQGGDGVLFYHSRVEPMAIVGTAKVVRSGVPDASQFDATSPYYDADATRNAPRWYCVDIAFDRAFAAPVTLASMKGEKKLREMVLLKRSRLSVQPVTAAEWRTIVALGGL